MSCAVLAAFGFSGGAASEPQTARFALTNVKLAGGGSARRRRDCHLAGTPSSSSLKRRPTGEEGCSRTTASPTANHTTDTHSPSLLKRIIKRGGVQQNESLADGQAQSLGCGVRSSGTTSRRRAGHFAGSPSLSLLKRVLKETGVQQNGSLADVQVRHQRGRPVRAAA